MHPDSDGPHAFTVPDSPTAPAHARGASSSSYTSPRQHGAGSASPFQDSRGFDRNGTTTRVSDVPELAYQESHTEVGGSTGSISDKSVDWEKK